MWFMRLDHSSYSMLISTVIFIVVGVTLSRYLDHTESIVTGTNR